MAKIVLSVSADELLTELCSSKVKLLAIKYNVSKQTISNHIKRQYPDFDAKKRFIFYIKANIDTIYQELYHNTIISTAKKYKTCVNTLRRIIKDRYPNFRQYDMVEYNYRFFEKVDNEDVAYWLGFLYADGCVGLYGKSCVIACELSVRDIQHLYKFRNTMKSTKSIKETMGDHNNILVNLRFHNRHMYNDLVRLGCIPRKSLILQFPDFTQVPDIFMKHFIRGFCDGDGSLHIANGRQRRVKFVGTIAFLTSLQNYLYDKGIIDRKYTIGYHINIRELVFANNKNVLSIVKYLYKDSTVYLDRKHKLAMEYIKYLEDYFITKEQKNGL